MDTSVCYVGYEAESVNSLQLVLELFTYRLEKQSAITLISSCSSSLFYGCPNCGRCTWAALQSLGCHENLHAATAQLLPRLACCNWIWFQPILSSLASSYVFAQITFRRSIVKTHLWHVLTAIYLKFLALYIGRLIATQLIAWMQETQRLTA